MVGKEGLFILAEVVADVREDAVVLIPVVVGKAENWWLLCDTAAISPDPPDGPAVG